MIAAALLAAALAASPARGAEEPIECPSGTHRVATSNPYEPFRCVKIGEENKKGFDSVVGPKGFSTRPRCPYGTRPVASPDNSLQPYRCVRSGADTQDPELAPMGVDGVDAPPAEETAAEPDPMTHGCPPGKHKVRTNDPLQPYHCVSQSSRVHTLDEGTYTRFSIPHQLSFEYPAGFRVQNSWKEDVPTLYLKLENPGAGKPVSFTITRYVESQSTYQEMSSAIARDVEWQGAKEGGALMMGGVRALVTYVPGDARSVYLPVAKDSYYSFVYSAPADSYENYLGAFTRLLKSMKIDRNAR
jgi:hypothetical protein